MKKLGLLAIIVISTSLLASCTNNPPTPSEPTKYNLRVTCNRGLVSGNKGEYEVDEEVALTFTPFEEHHLPDSLDYVTLTGIDKSAVTYESADGSLTFKMPANNVSVKITATVNRYNLDITCANGEVSGNQGEYKKNEEVTVTFTPDSNYLLPATAEEIEITGIDKSLVNYDSKSGVLNFKMPSNPVSISVTATDEFWYLDEDYINGLDTNDIGVKQTIKVNGINQTVRLIGVDHDVLTHGNDKAHTTWEFANLLCDSDGYSLATVWNRSNEGGSTNYDYLNSNLRKALDGKGNGELVWYRKGQETSEQQQATEYANKTVLDMLPSDLQKVIKEVNKPIDLYNSSSNEGYELNNNDYHTKIFPLSCIEMTEKEGNYDKLEGSTYDFYKGDGDTNENRLKHQIKWHDDAETSPKSVTDGKGTGYNYAGYNHVDAEKGGIAWVRSPDLTRGDFSFTPLENGELTSRSKVFLDANAVAPAFCLGITDEKWYLNEDYINSLDEDDVGIIRTLNVNGTDHAVRLIGIDHDNEVDEAGEVVGKAHTTWEFAELLSDSDGYSLATVWNWEQGDSSKNYDFSNSNLRKAFDGGGDGKLVWYRKGESTSEQTKETEYANKTVLDMLPSDLRDVLKVVKKETVKTSSYTPTTYDTKVFPLSYHELTEVEDEYVADGGSIYAFYKDSGDTNENRIKHQPKWHDGAVTEETKITDGKCSKSTNGAGFNWTNEKSGGDALLRSPAKNFVSTDKDRIVCVLDTGGGISTRLYFAYLHAYAVAPAFCI